MLPIDRGKCERNTRSLSATDHQTACYLTVRRVIRVCANFAIGGSNFFLGKTAKTCCCQNVAHHCVSPSCVIPLNSVVALHISPHIDAAIATPTIGLLSAHIHCYPPHVPKHSCYMHQARSVSGAASVSAQMRPLLALHQHFSSRYEAIDTLQHMEDLARYVYDACFSRVCLASV